MLINYENITLDMIEFYQSRYDCICNADNKFVEIIER